jgi:Domain of unknown function (DUF4402)
MVQPLRLLIVPFCMWVAVAVPVRAQPLCQLCAVTEAKAPVEKPKRAIHIDIETTLDFALAAHTDVGAGTIDLDPRTGERRVGNGLVGVGGPALRGTALITGEPFARVRINVPATIKLNSTMGAKAEVTGIVTSLTADPVLGADGRLEFNFGGRFSVSDGAAGEFHGRVQITADYQ